MRQSDKIIIWPAYFDSTKTRSSGRRIPKNIAVPQPKISEIKEAAEKLGIGCELVQDASYSKTPWIQAGMILVKKKEPKDQTLKKIARQLLVLRSTTSTTKQ